MDITDVAEELGLRKAGQKNGEHNYYDPADNNTPDLWINPRKNQWYTYAGGQNKGGGFLDLVVHVKNCDKEEAKRWVKDKFPEDYGKKNEKEIKKEEKALKVLETATNLAHDTLNKQKQGLKTRIKNNRDFTEEEIKKAKIGFLSQNDADILQKRFSKDALINSGLFTKDNDGEIYCNLSNRITFPYFNNHKPVFLAGRKHPESNSDSKYKKTYTTDFNRHILYQFRDDKDELIITEGFTDSISANKAGYDVVTPATTTFKDDDVRKIAKIASRYEKVYIVNDGDEAGEKGALKTAKELVEREINPYIVKLQDGKDLDDWTSENGYEDLENLLEKSSTFLDYILEQYSDGDLIDQKQEKKRLFRLLKDWQSSERKRLWNQLEEPTAEMEYQFTKWKKNSKTEDYNPYLEYYDEDQDSLNTVFLAQDIALDYDFVTLRDSDQFMIYKDGYWQSRAKTFIREEATERLGKHWEKHMKKQAVEWIRDSNYRDRSDFQPDKKKVNLENGVYDLEKGKMLPHSPAYKFPFKIPWKYKPGQECPKIDNFLDEITNGDETKKKKLYQLAAYTLLPDMPFAKAGMLAGPGGNGKTVFIELLKNLLGKNSDSYTNKTLHDLQKSFDMHELYGTLASFDDDIGSSKIPGEAAERFKKLTGGTDQGAEIKYGHQYDFEPYSTFIFAANHIPPTTDETKGFFRRWIIVNLPVSFVENPDPDNELQKQKKDKNELLNELTSKSEMEGFLSKCVEELETILEDNGFTNERTVKEKRKKWREHSTPLVSFIEKYVDQGMTKKEEERKKKNDKNPDWNTWNYDYIREDCLLDLITAYSKTRQGEDVKKTEVREALDKSDLFCNAGTQIRREPAELSSSSGTTRVISGIKMQLPKVPDESDYPRYFYSLTKNKYGSSNQSVEFVDPNISRNIREIVIDYIRNNYSSEPVLVDDLIDELMELEGVPDGRDRDDLEGIVDQLESDGIVFMPQAGKVQFL